jgi:hypothetical protein
VSAPSDKEGWRYVDLAVRRHCWDQYRRFHLLSALAIGTIFCVTMSGAHVPLPH